MSIKELKDRFKFESVQFGEDELSNALARWDLAYKKFAERWIKIEDFTPSEQPVWIKYKGAVRFSYCLVTPIGEARFAFPGMQGCYMTECITHVMPINEPDLPE